MRTTLTLDADVADRLQRAVRRSGKSLKSVVNEALRIGLELAEEIVEPSRFRIRAFVDGLQPGIDPEKMNQIADKIDAEELARQRYGQGEIVALVSPNEIVGQEMTAAKEAL